MNSLRSVYNFEIPFFCVRHKHKWYRQAENERLDKFALVFLSPNKLTLIVRNKKQPFLKLLYDIVERKIPYVVIHFEILSSISALLRMQPDLS